LGECRHDEIAVAAARPWRLETRLESTGVSLYRVQGDEVDWFSLVLPCYWYNYLQTTGLARDGGETSYQEMGSWGSRHSGQSTEQLNICQGKPRNLDSLHLLVSIIILSQCLILLSLTLKVNKTKISSLKNTSKIQFEVIKTNCAYMLVISIYWSSRLGEIGRPHEQNFCHATLKLIKNV